MGIDAEILVRNVPRSTVTDEWLKATSWDLCRSIGADKFFISADPKDTRLAIERTGTRYRDDESQEPGSVYTQDGEPILAEGDECLLEVNVWTRYYGEDYERGDILTLCAIAEWLEFNIEGCEVWYGGDSSGVLAKPFHARRRMELRRHLYSSHGRDYYNDRSTFLMRDACDKPVACSLCPDGKYRGNRCGWGGSGNSVYAAFSCGGCGKVLETRDTGKSWAERKEP
jgi:hypothetical protein